MALVNKIIPFSCIDGPGNRTSIFFQGCNFKCSYCHNPETINKCVNCGKCVAVCPVNALEIKDKKVVYHVGYNQTMSDVAPTTSLISCRINWTPYLEQAVRAVISGKRIESVVKSKLKGNDSAFGFDKDWVEMLGTNRIIVSPKMSSEIEKLKRQFNSGKLTVFKGNFIGVNPFDENDVWNLNTPFYENKEQSAPSFNYILQDCIIVRE